MNLQDAKQDFIVMPTSVTEVVQIDKQRRRMRWVIRICIGSLFVLLLLAIVGLLMLGLSEKDFEDAKAKFAQLNRNSTKAEAESLLGEAHVVSTLVTLKICVWEFRKHKLNQIEIYSITLLWDDEFRALSSDVSSVQGQDAWVLRWHLLKEYLGIKRMRKPRVYAWLFP